MNYENFTNEHPAGNFFQSLVFGKFQETIPYRGKSWTLTAKNEAGQIISSCLLVKQKLPFGLCWLWAPYGPIGFDEKIFQDAALIAKEEKAVFARFEPSLKWEGTAEIERVWPFSFSHKRYTPQNSLIIDLDKTPDEILGQMKPKGRYNIHVAKKHDVTIENLSGKRVDEIGFAFDEFYKILRSTGARDGFGVHPKSFYKNLLDIFGVERSALFLAYSKEKLIAGIVVIYHKNTATYYYGASDREYGALMAPYLLQWEAMMDAKRRGMTSYDLLGIAPSDGKPHALSGVTDFKKKFGGREIEYPRAFDVIYKKAWYTAWTLFSKKR